MAIIHQYLQKAFAPLSNHIKLPLSLVAHDLVKCAFAHSYVETLGHHADSLHSWVSKCEISDFRDSFDCIVKKSLRKLGVSYAQLAIDITSEQFYGSHRNLWIFDTDGESWPAEFRFIVVSLIVRNKQVPIMSRPVCLGEGVARPTIDMLECCLQKFVGIRMALFDRGFYCAELIDYMQAKNIKYLMLVPEKKGRIKDYVLSTETFGTFKHEMEYSKSKSKWRISTTIHVCKGVDDWAWIFATNMPRLGRVQAILLYKRRWQIETNFRVQDEARIKSKSCNVAVRMFYFFISLLLHLLWIVHKHIHSQIPFKRYLNLILNLLLQDYLEIHGT
jgi:Transposase DDE domain